MNPERERSRSRRSRARCANVGTFGALDPANTDALEIRPLNGALVRAEDRAGYNVPSLYSLALGAPYLHCGQAPTLSGLFTNPRWQFHTNAGNVNMSVLAEHREARRLHGVLALDR